MISAEQSTHIRVPLGMVFAFYAYPPNAQLLPVRGYRLSDFALPAFPGRDASFGFTVRSWWWTGAVRMRWEVYEEPASDTATTARLVAVATDGVFPQLRHEIDLRAEGAVVHVTERISCALPGGLWSRLGARFAPRELGKVLATRKKLAKRILEAAKQPVLAPQDGASAAAFLAVQIISENNARSPGS